MIIKITYGLPGSGKTFWAKQNASEHYYGRPSNVIHVDELKKANPESIARAVKARGSMDCVIIDALVTTEEQLKAIIDAIRSVYKRKKLEFHVEFWKKNVEGCLANDSNRSGPGWAGGLRKKTAAASIKRLAKNYKKPKLEEVSVINEHEVVYNVSYVDWHEKYSAYTPWRVRKDSRYLYSDHWSLGGSECNYSGDEWTIPAEPPKEFKEFVELLCDVWPDITFMQYKKIRNATVTTESADNSDYYSSEKVAYWRCDLQELERLMKEMKQ